LFEFLLFCDGQLAVVTGSELLFGTSDWIM